MTDTRAAWIGTCVFWAWSWAAAAVFLAWTVIGLLLFIPAALAVWAIWAPIGVPQPTYPALPHGQYGTPPAMPPHSPGTWGRQL